MSDTKGYSICIVDEDGNDVLDLSVETGMEEFLTWWIGTAVRDFNRTVPKIEEYGLGDGRQEGSADLRAIGDFYSELLGWDADTPSALKQELAAWTYLTGKVGRCISNYQNRDSAKEDTIFDAGIYILMMRRLKENGQWP